MKTLLRSAQLATCTAILLVLTACATGSQWSRHEFNGDVKSILARQKELSKPNLDLSQVTIVRLQMQGEGLAAAQRVDVSSLTPAMFKNQAFGWAYAQSLASLDEARTQLRFFTFDVRRDKAYEAVFPLAELTPGRTIHFPILGPEGFAVDRSFTVEQIIVQ